MHRGLIIASFAGRLELRWWRDSGDEPLDCDVGAQMVHDAIAREPELVHAVARWLLDAPMSHEARDVAGRVASLVAAGHLWAYDLGMERFSAVAGLPGRPPSTPPPKKTKKPVARVDPLVDAAPFVLVPHVGFAVRRTLVTGVSEAFDGQGVLTGGGDQCALYTASEGGDPLSLPLTLEGPALNAGIALYLGASAPSATVNDIALTLALNGGSKNRGAPATTTVTAVRLTVDVMADPRGAGGETPISASEKYEIGRLVARADPKWHDDVHTTTGGGFDETVELDPHRWDHPRVRLDLRVEPSGIDAAIRLAQKGSALTLHDSEGTPWSELIADHSVLPWPYQAQVSDLPPSLWLTGKATGKARLELSLLGSGVGDAAEIRVISAHFAESYDAAYGYDDMDMMAGRMHHLSVASGGATEVSLSLAGPHGGRLVLTTTEGGVATPTAPDFPENETIGVRIDGAPDVLRAATILQLRMGAADGPVLAAIGVHTYRLVRFDLRLMPVHDPASPSTSFDFAPPPTEILRASLNEILRQVVAEIGSLEIAPVAHIAFDADHNGIVDATTDGSDEADAIFDGVTSPPGTRTVAVVRDIRHLFAVAGALSAGDTTIVLDATVSEHWAAVIDPHDGYLLTSDLPGVPDDEVRAEPVAVTSRAGHTVTLAAPLAHSYPRAAIVRDSGGVGRSGHPVGIVDLGPDLTIVVAHELGHGLFDLRDTVDPESSNLMDGTRPAPARLRYKRLARRYSYLPVDPGDDAAHQRQWDAVPRQPPTAALLHDSALPRDSASPDLDWID
jgi:hypothetical protein